MLTLDTFKLTAKNNSGTETVRGKAIDWRIKWSSEWQEYVCNVKLATDKRWNADAAYHTDDATDAHESVLAMIEWLSRK